MNLKHYCLSLATALLLNSRSRMKEIKTCIFNFCSIGDNCLPAILKSLLIALMLSSLIWRSLYRTKITSFRISSSLAPLSYSVRSFPTSYLKYSIAFCGYYLLFTMLVTASRCWKNFVKCCEMMTLTSFDDMTSFEYLMNFSVAAISPT